MLYGRMLDIWPIIEHSQVSFVNFTSKHVYMIFFRCNGCLVIINEQNEWSSSKNTSHRLENVLSGTTALTSHHT